ncbi:MAG: helix-turn-helix domain-containing protein [Pseudobacter sp.]|uniref:helix-turn-helix domain-containing protein n=1 Tax=Pseudobacter sp. TaxID=2045420 RepID=UPI003F7E0CC6
MHKNATRSYYQAVALRLLEFIDAHLQDDITADLLAEHVYVSKDHLAVIFAQVQEEPIGKYIRRARLERAAALVTYSCRPLSQVAELVGYSGKHALSKSFRQHFGNSPGRYRKRLGYWKHSPNVILDGIASEEEYLSLIDEHFEFSHRFEELYDHYTLCRPLRMVTALASNGFSYEFYQQQTEQEFLSLQAGGRFVVRPFDSINFCPAAYFNMHHGLLLHKSMVDALPVEIRQQYFLSAIRNGKYLVLDIPGGDAEAQVKRYTTLFRENLIGRQRLFDLDDFCTFLLPGNNPASAGQFYIFLRD